MSSFRPITCSDADSVLGDLSHEYAVPAPGDPHQTGSPKTPPRTFLMSSFSVDCRRSVSPRRADLLQGQVCPVGRLKAMNDCKGRGRYPERLPRSGWSKRLHEISGYREWHRDRWQTYLRHNRTPAQILHPPALSQKRCQRYERPEPAREVSWASLSLGSAVRLRRPSRVDQLALRSLITFAEPGLPGRRWVKSGSRDLSVE